MVVSATISSQKTAKCLESFAKIVNWQTKKKLKNPENVLKFIFLELIPHNFPTNGQFIMTLVLLDSKYSNANSIFISSSDKTVWPAVVVIDTIKDHVFFELLRLSSR